jgi:hypothetical protein
MIKPFGVLLRRYTATLRSHYLTSTLDMVLLKYPSIALSQPLFRGNFYSAAAPNEIFRTLRCSFSLLRGDHV